MGKSCPIFRHDACKILLRVLANILARFLQVIMERFLPLSWRIHDLILNGSCMHLGYTLCQELGRSVQVSWVNLVPFSGMMLVRSYLEFLQIFLQDFYKLSCQDLTRCIDSPPPPPPPPPHFWWSPASSQNSYQEVLSMFCARN